MSGRQASYGRRSLLTALVALLLPGLILLTGNSITNFLFNWLAVKQKGKVSGSSQIFQFVQWLISPFTAFGLAALLAIIGLVFAFHALRARQHLLAGLGLAANTFLLFVALTYSYFLTHSD